MFFIWLRDMNASFLQNLEYGICLIDICGITEITSKGHLRVVTTKELSSGLTRRFSTFFYACDN